METEIRLLSATDETPYHLLLDADPSRKLVDGYMAKGGTYVALTENRIVGVSVLVKLNEHTLEIKNLAVAENMQGKGLGTKLIENAFRVAKQQGCKTILIATSAPNTGPLYLYQKMGFEYDYIVKHYFDNNIDNYDGPLFDNGIKCNHLVVLSKTIG